jgi:hypothetical protein
VRLPIVIVSTLAGLLAVGCASSSSSSSTAPLTKAQFVAQGNEICKLGNVKLAQAEKALGSEPGAARYTAFVTGPFRTEVQRQIDALRLLRAPAGEQRAVKRILELAQADLDRVSADPKTLATETPSPFHSFSTRAHAYGLTACAENT